MKRTIIIFLALCALMAQSGQSQADMTSMLPLAVGNSWEYKLNVEIVAWGPSPELSVPLSITHTEKRYSSDPYHYYVFSDLPVFDSPVDIGGGLTMPWESPPLPFFFLAGKKVRWSEDGQALLLYTEWFGDVALFRFDGNYKVRELYDLFPHTIGRMFNRGAPGGVYTSDGSLPPLGYPDLDVDVRFDLLGEEDQLVVQFRFPPRLVFQGGSGSSEGDVSFTFTKGLGLVAATGYEYGIGCDEYMGYYNPTAQCFSDVGGIEIDLRLGSAVIDGVQWEEGAHIPTVVQEHSWGAVKDHFKCLNCEE